MGGAIARRSCPLIFRSILWRQQACLIGPDDILDAIQEHRCSSPMHGRSHRIIMNVK
nr:MAG TPA: hypothetical protein [Caudoviricetes sp.]